MHVRRIISAAAIPSLVLLGLSLAGVLKMLGHTSWIDTILLITVIIGVVPLILDVFQSLLRRQFGVDIIAIVAIVASLWLGEYLAGAMIVLMLSGGEALEDFALRRARKDLTALLSRSPQIVHRLIGGSMTDVSPEVVQVNDVILVKPGEVIPVDGRVFFGSATVDESALTGESHPVRKAIGAPVMSGSVCNDAVLHITVEKPAAESRYARLVELVQAAESKRSPFVRLADRSAVWFTAVTFVWALVAWFLSHDPVRLLAVLVVATPCPLILATPIAFAAGIGRAAERGIIIKDATALEKLGNAQALLFDKTGTLTLGTPVLVETETFGIEADMAIAIAASLDQYSLHILAKSFGLAASERHLSLQNPVNFREVFGEGVEGECNGQWYRLGRLSFLERSGVVLSDTVRARHDAARSKGHSLVYLARDTQLVAIFSFTDQIRTGSQELFTRLRQAGISHVRMLTGDKQNIAAEVAREVGLAPHEVMAECLPEDKVKAVEQMKLQARPVVMVGDGINDAPALAAADVGIAMGGHGQTASAEAGDVVILGDKIERVVEAVQIGHRVMRIAKQSIGIGIGLSICLMILAAFGFVKPVFGALLQELIDVLVILNALRVLIKPRAQVTESSSN